MRDTRVAEITLGDGPLEIHVRRAGAKARFSVHYDGQTIVDEPVELPALSTSPAFSGPLFRPAPDSRAPDPAHALHRPGEPLYVIEDELGRPRWYTRGRHGPGLGARPLLATIPSLPPESLGAPSFRQAHRCRYAYIAGAMAGGIASVELVRAMAQARLLAFFGSGGLPLAAVREAIEALSDLPEGAPWGANLLHNPTEPAVEEATVDLYLERGVQRVSASAYIDLSPAVVRYRLHGIKAAPDGTPILRQHVFAKVSRPEVAEPFLKPAPQSMLRELVERGALTEKQARIAAQVPIACDITAEADSGGHTDHRPLVVLLPILQALRDRIAPLVPGFTLRVGAAGGLGTPASVWAAFAMGADYVLTGSVNQATLEAGTSDLTRQLLCEASYTDVASGPAPDMFEIGAKVQVLSRGSMYARRAQQLYDLYRSVPSLEAIPDKERSRLERQIFQRPLDEVWRGTRAYWSERDPAQVERAEREPRHKMALTFRWYLGMTSRWARTGEQSRKRDFQIWCGPAIGGFNDWVDGSELQTRRSVVPIAHALMIGAAAHGRISAARSQGIPLPPAVCQVPIVPWPAAEPGAMKE
ncbi:MAG: PfaD family polyunsaturated fatty acid/polyketide biosynthesis protein [Deltaproteobacteria bacterium]|nr:MAG: PfaD family polyunsaturated fatty acid/polyketide biosynthesis protein [Deltaproteobacteria bacterium]